MFVRSRIPLPALERHELELDETLVASARRELLAPADQGADAAFRSGFLLGVQADPHSHPSCLTLARDMHRRLLGDLEQAHGLSFELSFMKLAEGVVPATAEGPFYEGPHLDTHPALEGSRELLRLLVNLSRHPRRFMYVATDRWALARQGIGHDRRTFEPLTLPAGLERRIVAIPGRTERTVHALKFFASAIPHVGLNDPPEHFLVSFESVADLARGCPL